MRRTFSGTNNDLWNEFILYFENIAELNMWSNEKKRRVLLSTLRGQAESYAYGMPLIVQRDYFRLKEKMEVRFGHSALKERFVTEAKLRKRQPNESLRDFGQAIEDLYRRAYPDNPEIVEENSIKSFLDKCGQSEEFRLAVKRTRPKTLQEAVINSMQEECLRAGEKDLAKDGRPIQRPIYEVGDDIDTREVGTNTGRFTRGDFIRNQVSYGPYRNQNDVNSYPRYNGIRSQARPYQRSIARGRGRGDVYGNCPQNFRAEGRACRDSRETPLN